MLYDCKDADQARKILKKSNISWDEELNGSFGSVVFIRNKADVGWFNGEERCLNVYRKPIYNR